MSYPPTIILRHRRENLKKCSLRTLPKRPDIQILTYPKDLLPKLPYYLLLKVGAPPLTIEDRDRGVLLIDATWRLARVMERQCPLLEMRSLPSHFRTAYPRRQLDCSDPEVGLATLEALYLAYKILERPCSDLLEGYFWKKEFLEKNNDPIVCS